MGVSEEIKGNIALILPVIVAFITGLILVFVFGSPIIGFALLGLGLGALHGYSLMRKLLLKQMIELGLVVKRGKRHYFIEVRAKKEAKVNGKGLD